MKILIGINTLSSGGAEVFSAELAVAYRRKGHEVTLVVYGGILNSKGEYLQKYLKANDVKTIDLSNKAKILLPYYYQRMVAKLKPDLIHSNLEQTDLLLIITKPFNKGAKYIRTLHNIKILDTYPIWLHRFLFKSYDKNIGCSQFTKTHFQIEELKKEIISIENGVDISRLRTDGELVAKNKGETVFIVIGTSQKRFGKYQKGHDLIIESFKQIREPYKVFFLGNLQNMEEDFPDALENPYFKLVGIISDINEYLSIADFVLAPSRFEGLPISIIEAVCSGVPLICSNIEGFLPFSNDSTLFFENENIKDMILKLQEAIEKRDYFKQLAFKNKEKYIKKFDINEVATQYLNLN
jgi:glycosyltransferase involved in cell wall biosynthesis